MYIFQQIKSKQNVCGIINGYYGEYCQNTCRRSFKRTTLFLDDLENNNNNSLRQNRKFEKKNRFLRGRVTYFLNN